MDGLNDRIEYLHFNHSTLALNPALLRDLAVFYCNIWTFDENFEEYMICPVCKKYFSEKLVLEGALSCSGENSDHEETPLVVAWIPDKVSEETLDTALKYGNDFYGVIAYDTQDNRVVGFTWGYRESWDKISQDWGETILSMLYTGNQDGALYYSELAAEPKLRQHGIGSRLVFELTSWMKRTYPNLPTFLRTHKNSKARRLFERVGYRYFADDPEHGDGRIMMDVFSCRELTPEKL